MTIRDWLYGSPTERSYVLDLDTVREVVARVREADPRMTTELYVHGDDGLRRVISDNDLGGLSAADRRRLAISARFPQGPPDPGYNGIIAIDVTFRRGVQPQVTAQPSNTPETLQLEQQIWYVLSSSGRPILLPPRRPVELLMCAPILAFIVSWLWLELTTPLPLPAHSLGWVVVVIGLLLTVRALRARWHQTRYNGPHVRYPGHRIRPETRAETNARRADSHRDLKVAILTAGTTVVTGVIVAAILVALGWNVQIP